MDKSQVVIGEKEKHTLGIGWSKWWGDVTINIDGLLKKDLPFQDPYFWTTFQRSYDFTIGENEPHSVHIEVDGNFNPPLKVVVDGKAIQLLVDGGSTMPEAYGSTRFEVHPRLNTFQGALKFNLTASTEQEPRSFWQRHFEGKLVLEEMSYSDFLAKIRTALSELGFENIIDIKLDHNVVFRSKSPLDSDGEKDLSDGINAALVGIAPTGGKEVPHEVEINVAKRTDVLREHLRLSYSTKHEVNNHPLCLYLRFAPIDSTQDKNQSLGDYQNGLNLKYGPPIKNDLMTIYRKIARIFPISDDHQVLQLEDPRGQEISLSL